MTVGVPRKQTVSAANEREPGLGPRAWGGALVIAHPDSRQCGGQGGGVSYEQR